MLPLCMLLMDIMDCMDMDMALVWDTIHTLLDMPGMDTMARDLLRLSQRLMLMHSMVLMAMVCMDLDTELILLDMDMDMVLDMDTLLFIMGMVMVMDMDTMDKLTV